MNVREDMALKWKDEKTFVKLVTGKMLKYELKHVETVSNQSIYLIEKEEISETLGTDQIIQDQNNTFYSMFGNKWAKIKEDYKKKQDTGSLGFQLILNKLGFNIQCGSHRIILNSVMQDTSGTANVIWSQNHIYYSMPQQTIFNLRSPPQNPDALYIEMPFGEQRARLTMKTQNPMIYSNLAVTRRRKDGYDTEEPANDPMLWKIEVVE